MKDNNFVTRSGNNTQLPPFIVDHSTRTTYSKGKFLGKLVDIHITTDPHPEIRFVYHLEIGGFARVHELSDLTTSKVYAAKIIPKNRITKPHHREKIIREIELHRTLKHENIVRFQHFFEDEENVYIILENCPRKAIHVLKHRRTLSEPEVRYYIKQLVAGVQYIHGQNVIHRDLKLGNMLLSEDMVVKIADFGLAARAEQIGSEKISICGTPNYIAPEVLDKKGYSYGADVWAIGCIMYAMLVGQPPFETSTLKETYSRISSNKYVIPPLISNDARALISNLLHPDPNQRLDLTSVLNHKFFTRGFMPECLPPSSCTSLPNFSSAAVISKSAAGSQELSARPNSLSTKKPKTLTATVLLEHLSNGLDAMKEGSSKYIVNGDNATVLFVVKWIDYSNKYGFGFQLSDQSVGVLFNNGSKISYSPDRTRVEFYDCDGKLMVHSSSSVPITMQDHYTLLKYFAKYMDENLTDGRNTSVFRLQAQLNFFKDHTKIIISDGNDGLLVSYIDENRSCRTFPLLHLIQDCCPSLIFQRLLHVRSMLRDFAQLETTDLKCDSDS
uniref:polo kinase n=1 Tax=Strigamia maritima TaxID=126957 RepID=T1J1L9_STRMM